MATLILTAVGTALGGPIGGALGALAGQQVDQRLLAPGPRQGPRLGDLSVQTSTYGGDIPRLFGTLRVAGTVIWATDLIESRGTSGGGKGRPRTVTYSYSASFAVALSARPIRAIRRIWADGKLLRGAAGDFKSETGFRFYPGDEDQPVDPLIASAEGAATTPAYRGIAYAVFENFQLEDYGNRIPSLTFEVEADQGAVAIGAIASALSDGAILAGATPAVRGYAASGQSVRAAVQALTDIVPLSLTDDGATLRLGLAQGEAMTIAAGEETERRRIERSALASVPDEVSIAYYEPARDYQAGLQRASATGGPGRRADRRQLPAALDAGAAKGLAEYRLAALRAGRARARVALGWRRAATGPGALARFDGVGGLWRISRWTLGAARVGLELAGMAGGAPIEAPADAGRPAAAPDLPHGPTVLRAAELPLGETTGGRPLILAFAAGGAPGWRRAELMASFDGGASWSAAGRASGPATMGVTLAALPARPSTLFDTASALEIELLGDAMWLEGADDDALANGANLALVGRELVQFGRAEALGGGRFRLSRLLRGRRGTEWAAALHAAGEPFVLIEPDRLVAIEAPAGALGGVALLSASGVGDEGDVAAEVAIEGDSLRPPAPVHLAATREAGGDILLRWTRRSRDGWSWTSGAETPLGEQKEAYRLELSGAGFARAVELAAPEWRYTGAAQAADGASAPIDVSVVQLGTYAPSRPARLTIA